MEDPVSEVPVRRCHIRRTSYHPELQEFLFTWKIENLNLRMGQSDIALDSSSFTLDPIGATRMFLRLVPRNDKNEVLNLQLHRAIDNGPRRIALSYKFHIRDGCLDDDTHVLTTSRVKRAFRVGTHLISPEHRDCPRPFVWRRRLLEPGRELAIRCHVLPLGGSLSSSVDEDPEILRLSKDLSLLYENEIGSDIVLCAGKEKFKAHRSILCARSPTFARELEEQSSVQGTVEVKSELSAPVLKSLLRYLYTGRLADEVPDLASGMYSAAVKYEVTDLLWKLYTFPKKAFIFTKFNTEVKTISWSIKDFGDLETTVKVFSPVISMDNVVVCDFQLILYISANTDIPIGNQSIPNIRISVRKLFSERVKLVSLYCKLAVIDVGRKLDMYSTEYHLFVDDKDWLFPSFLNSYKLIANRRTYLPKNTLSLFCEFIVSDGLSKSLAQDTAIESFLQQPESLRSFVTDIQEIYVSKKFSDIMVCVRDAKVPAHKAILCARSPTLKVLCEEKEQLKEISIVTEKETLDKMLLHLYSGEYPDLEDYKAAMQLYVVANELKVPQIKEYCHEYLLACLSVGNALEMLDAADEYKDPELQSWLEHFINLHAGEINAASRLQLIFEYTRERSHHKSCTIL